MPPPSKIRTHRRYVRNTNFKNSSSNKLIEINPQNASMSRGHRHAPAMPTTQVWPDWTSRRARIVRVCRSNRVKSARNSARVIWKTDQRESAFVSLSICVAHARHGSHVRYCATSTMHAACVTSIFRSCSGESHFSWSRREKNLEDVVAQLRAT